MDLAICLAKSAVRFIRFYFSVIYRVLGMSFGAESNGVESPLMVAWHWWSRTPELSSGLVLLARVVVVGSKPLVEGISMKPHCFGRLGLVPLVLFQSRHDDIEFEI